MFPVPAKSRCLPRPIPHLTFGPYPIELFCLCLVCLSASQLTHIPFSITNPAPDSTLADTSRMTTSTSTTERENVLLFGLGGIGGIYACILHLSRKCDVSVVARSNYNAVSEKGFRLVSPKFGDHPSIKFAGGQCRFCGWLNCEFQA